MSKIFKIFFSWQSDLSPEFHRDLIENALRDAASRLSEITEVEAVVDRDVVGIPGSPDIVDSILHKIETCNVFVADISLIHKGTDGKRPTPNPNVSIETGFALRAKGWAKMILILNVESGAPETLPFDLRKHKVLVFDSRGKTADVLRVQLAGELLLALKEILEREVDSPQIAPEIVRLRQSLEQDRKDSKAAAFSVTQWFFSQVDAIAPNLNRSGVGLDQELIDAINKTEQLCLNLLNAVVLAAEFGNSEAIRGFYTGFSGFLDRCENSAAGTHYSYQFDFYRFLGHEILASTIGILFRHERFEVLEELLYAPMKAGVTKGRNPYSPAELSLVTSLLDETNNLRLKRELASVRATMLRERHESGALSTCVPFGVLGLGDLLLFLASLSKNPNDGSRYWTWWPWTSVYSEASREFVSFHYSRKTYDAIRTIVGVKGQEEYVRDLLKRASEALFSLWRRKNIFYDWVLSDGLIKEFGSQP